MATKIFSLIKLIFINVSLAVWLLVALFMCFELWYRHSDREHQIKQIYETTDEYHYARPYVMAAGKPGLEFHGDIHNVLGYRHFPPVSKAEDEIRVVMIGGSTVHAGKVSLPMHLEKILREKTGKNIRVYNMGIGSSVSKQDVTRIFSDLGGYSPDLVIHYGGGNDFIPVDRRINYPHRFYYYESNIHFTKSVDDYDWVLSLAMGSEFLRHYIQPYLVERLQDKIEIRVPPKGQREELRARAYIENMVWGKILSGDIGAKYLGVFQPILFYKPVRSPEEERYSHEKEPAMLRQIYYKEIESGKYPIKPLDCSDVFKDIEKTVYTDEIHLKDEFRHVPAECIANEVLSRPELLKGGTSKFAFTPEEYYLIGY